MGIVKSRSILFMALALSSVAANQLSENGSLIEVSRNNRFVKYHAVMPAALQDAFPNQKATAGIRERLLFNRGDLFDSIIEKLEMIKLSAYTNYKPPKRGPDGGTAQVQSHTVFFPAAIYDGEIYVFYRGDQTASVAVINKLLGKLEVSVSSPGEAQQLAEFYLLLYSNNFRDPAKLIISRIEDIPEKYRMGRNELAEKTRSMIHPLKVTQRDGSYEVGFFTWENLPRGEVIKWQMIITLAAKLEVKQEVVALI